MLRLSSSPFPSKADVANASGLPFSALVSPLAPSPGLDADALDLSSSVPADKRASYASVSAPEASFVPRCFRCAGYISAHCPLTVRIWRCILCGAQNTLPSRYLPVVRAGEAALTLIPELSRPVYDVPVADEVHVTPLAYIFVIDVHGDEAYLDSMRAAVRNALDVVEGQSFAGVILYGEKVQLVDTRPSAQSGVDDINNNDNDNNNSNSNGPRTPTHTLATPRDFPSECGNLPPDQWLRRTGSKLTSAIIAALAKLPGNPLAKDPTREPRRAMGPAIRVALDMVEGASLTGARVVVLAGGQPNFGDGALGIKDMIGISTMAPSVGTSISTPSTMNGSILNPPALTIPSHTPSFPTAPATASSRVEPQVLDDCFPAPSTPFYMEQGARASMLGTMIDIYLTSGKPMDIASLSPLAQFSGGRLVVYDGCASAVDSSLANDVWQHLNDPTLIRGLLRVRTTADLIPHEVYGTGLFRDAEVEDVFRLSCHGHGSTLAVELGLPDKPPRNKRFLPNAAAIQVAVRGVFVEPGMLPQRVLRVETTTVDTVESNTRAIWEGADANAVAATMFHKAVAAADEHGISAARVLLFDWLAQLVIRGAELHPMDQLLTSSGDGGGNKSSNRVKYDAMPNENVPTISMSNINGTASVYGQRKNGHDSLMSNGNGNGVYSINTQNQNQAQAQAQDHDQDTLTWLDLYDGLRPLPQLIFGLVRSFLFRPEAVAADVRSATRCIWEDLNPELLSAAAYPKLVSFRSVDGSDVNPSDVIGWSLPLSSSAVARCGHDVFLVDALSQVVVFYTAGGCAKYAYPPPDGSVVAKVKAQCQRDRPVTPHTVTCREGTVDEKWFRGLLIEDGPGAIQGGSAEAQSYRQFMQGIKDTAGLA